MRRIWAMGIALFLFLALAGCGGHRGDAMQTSEASSALGDAEMDEALSQLGQKTLSDEQLAALREHDFLLYGRSTVICIAWGLIRSSQYSKGWQG